MGFRVLGCHVDTKAIFLLKKMATLDQLPEDKVYSKAVLVSIKNQWFSNTAERSKEGALHSMILFLLESCRINVATNKLWVLSSSINYLDFWTRESA
jgi:hypothetical protein